MTLLEKMQLKHELSAQAFLLVCTGLILLATFFLPYATAQGEHDAEIANFEKMVDTYELLLNVSEESAPEGLQTLQSLNMRQLSMFNCAKFNFFIWDSSNADNALDGIDSIGKITICLALCLPLLSAIIPIAIILNALGRKPFWVLFFIGAAYGNFLWQCSYLDIKHLISSGMYRPGIVLRLFPCVCIISVILALWMWVKKILVKRKIKSDRTIQP